MIVIAIIGILAAALYPYMMWYLSRGRDVTRISDIKELSAKFQEYTHTFEVYPDNQNIDTTTSYCVTTMLWWDDASPKKTQWARQYTTLKWTDNIRKDATINNPKIGLCNLDGSYFYARVMLETDYAVLAARMENIVTWANWWTGGSLTDSGSIDGMIQGKPLNKDFIYTDNLFVLVTN